MQSLHALQRGADNFGAVGKDLQQFRSADIAQRLGVPPVTVRRWLRTGKWPALARLAALVILGGDLGEIDPAWRGWTLNGRGELCSPENWTYSPGDVMSLTFERARASSYQAKLRYAKQADFIERRYVEPDETLGTPGAREAS